MFLKYSKVHLIFFILMIAGVVIYPFENVHAQAFQIYNGNNQISNGSFERKCSGDVVVYSIPFNPYFSNFRWYNLSNTSVTLSNTDTFAVATVNKTNSNIIQNFLASADSAGFPVYDTLRVITLYRPVVNLGNDTVVCEGSKVTLMNKIPTAPLLPVRYMYYKILSPVSKTKVDSVASIAVKDSGLYQLTVTFSTLFNTCANSDQVHIGYLPSPVFLGSDTVVCANGTTYLHAKQLSAGSLPYTIIKWRPGNLVSDSTSLTTTANIQTDQVFHLIVVDGKGCADTANLNITLSLPVYANPVFTDTVTCPGNSVTLKLSPSGGYPFLNPVRKYIYKWSPSSGLNDSTAANPMANPLVSTDYSVTVRDSVGCTQTVAINIKKSDLGIYLYHKPTVNVCNGDSTTLYARGTGSGDSTQFRFNWSPVTLFKNPNLQNNTTLPVINPAKVYASVSYKGCSLMDSLQLGIFSLPSVLASSHLDTLSCPGNAKLVSATASGGNSASYTYVWYSVDAPSYSTLASASLKLPAGKLNEIYMVKATDANGCVSAPDTVKLLTVNAPTGLIQSLSAMYCRDSLLNFQAVTTNASSVKWQFDQSGSYEQGIHVGATFDDLADHKVTLFVTSASGCVVKDSILFATVLCGKIFDNIFVPNAFNPQSQNYENQRLKVYGESIDEQGFTFRVYNVWGNVVYQTDNLAEAKQYGWDGTLNGSPLASGVYTYVVKGKYMDGSDLKTKGSATLIR